MRRLEGKVAIITGAKLIGAEGLNIGSATALAMAREGAKLLVANHTESGAAALAQKIREGGGDALSCHIDLGVESSIKEMIAHAMNKWSRIDILVNNGTAVPGEDVDLLNTPTEVWDRVMDVNARGVFLASKYVLPSMLANGGGSIVNVSSASGLLGDSTRTAYGASKAAINMLTKYIAAQYGKKGVRCNCILPGRVVTASSRMRPELNKLFEKQALTPYLGTPEHLANAILFLASDEAAFITGQVLAVDGGALAHQPQMADFLEISPTAATVVRT